MTISKAVKRAMKKGMYITTPEFRGKTKIKPTNDGGRCILMEADGSHPSEGGWQPDAKDFIRSDWKVVN